jgi:RNA polymerase sigma-70 factor, ECF subfamily
VGAEGSGSYDELYAATADRLVRQVYALTGDLGEAQDVVQEAFVRAWQHWRTVASHPDPEAWVRTTARRLAVSRWRKLRNSKAAWERHGSPQDAAPVGPDTVALVAALRQLPEAQRTALVLHHLADLPVEQVARETGAPVGTVKARLSRGRDALAELLRDDSVAPRRDEVSRA